MSEEPIYVNKEQKSLAEKTDYYLLELRKDDLPSLIDEFNKSIFEKENLKELKMVRGKLRQFLRFVEVEIDSLECGK